jgi:hypothetical protein
MLVEAWRLRQRRNDRASEGGPHGHPLSLDVNPAVVRRAGRFLSRLAENMSFEQANLTGGFVRSA